MIGKGRCRRSGMVQVKIDGVRKTSGGRRLGIQRTMLLDSLFGWEKDRASTSRQSVSLVVRDVLNDAIASCSSGVGLLA